LQNGDFSILILKLGYMKFKSPWTKYGDLNLFSSSKYGEFGPFEKEKEKVCLGHQASSKLAIVQKN
jgi:hypothetical protein